MVYVLESDAEFDRLEKQTRFAKHDFRDELAGLEFAENRAVLDAGCGSGIVSRHIAKSTPSARVVGCDLAAARVDRARAAAHDLKNLEFRAADLTRLPFGENEFSTLVCRYVLEHMPRAAQALAAQEAFRVLEPGGVARYIDFDGTFVNLHPCEGFLKECMAKIQSAPGMDFHVGRRIPALLCEAGFTDVSWRIVAIGTKEELRDQERQLMPERMDNARGFLESVLGGASIASRFRDEYLRVLEAPGTVLLENKFIVTGRKPEMAKARKAA